METSNGKPEKKTEKNFKWIDCFCIQSLDYQTVRSEKNTGQKVLKERIKGNNIRHETVGHMDSFTENSFRFFERLLKELSNQKLMNGRSSF